MTSITAGHMVEAMRRWSDFERVNSPSAEEIEQAQERIDAGEPAMEALSELRRRNSRDLSAQLGAICTLRQIGHAWTNLKSGYAQRTPLARTAQQLAEETPGEGT